MPTPIRRFSGPLAASFGATMLLTTGCPSPREETAPAPAAAQAPPVGCQADGGALQLGCPAFPNTTPTAQPQWDYFAWNSFIAANWPAVVPAQNNEQRGFPDLGKSFATAAGDSLLVWETFKEKREVFVQGSSSNPGPWNQAPVYGPVTPTVVPLCTASQDRADKPRRFFGQGGKIIFDSLDETIEVASEALESQSALCGGYPNPQCGTPQQKDCCLVPTLAVGPRVWKGSPTRPDPQPVLYEVKVNYDFYNYVTANQLYLDATAATQAQQGKILLPYRTSAGKVPLSPSGTAGPPSPQSKLGYVAQSCVDHYGKITPTSNLTPCSIGSLHLKAAWIELQDEDPAKYHTAEAAYFKTENRTTCMTYGTFGLIGLHIIQRIHQGPPANVPANPLGGTYIFATWEHADNDTAGFTYANYFPGRPLEPPPIPGWYPLPSSALPVQRKFPILASTRQVNDKVHAAIAAVDPSSVWLNYKLVGVQFQPVNVNAPPPAQPRFPVGPNDPTGIGQPLYLANLVIETNEGLQHFQGLPGGTVPISNFPFITKNAGPAFNRSTPNLAFFGKGYNMGGCMGCHGVAEVKGYSFSFVLLGGQQLAGTDTQQRADIPPLKPPVGPR
ncbi:MAG TPA: hypothetical protein VNJ70_04445 [Thermoanaerobaculia bacterium]|nr:hypothetical protein [Thermoanaerobaculia bacterium]